MKTEDTNTQQGTQAAEVQEHSVVEKDQRVNRWLSEICGYCRKEVGYSCMSDEDYKSCRNHR